MYQVAHLPHEIVVGDNYTLQCIGTSPEHRKIVAGYKSFTSLFYLTKAFPDLIYHPLALASCANFLFTGDTFKVIKDPQEFQKNYFNNISKIIHSKLGPIEIQRLHSPKFQGNHFVFFAWNQVNDLPYRVSCQYPFSLTKPEVLYELLQF